MSYNGKDVNLFYGGREVSSTNRFPISPSGTLVSEVYDYIAANYAGATTDVYTYKTGGSGGATVATVTITYTDSSKATISSVAKT